LREHELKPLARAMEAIDTGEMGSNRAQRSMLWFMGLTGKRPANKNRSVDDKR